MSAGRTRGRGIRFPLEGERRRPVGGGGGRNVRSWGPGQGYRGKEIEFGRGGRRKEAKSWMTNSGMGFRNFKGRSGKLGK